MASFKMQQIIKQTSPSRQLFETINFVFMNFFYFLVKLAIFRTFLLFSGDFRQALWPYTVYLEHLIQADMHDENLSEKRRNAQKMAILSKELKNFIKAKLTASKSCLLGLVYFIICCILRDAILLSLDLLKFQSLEFQTFQHF